MLSNYFCSFILLGVYRLHCYHLINQNQADSIISTSEVRLEVTMINTIVTEFIQLCLSTNLMSKTKSAAATDGHWHLCFSLLIFCAILHTTNSIRNMKHFEFMLNQKHFEFIHDTKTSRIFTSHKNVQICKVDV